MDVITRHVDGAWARRVGGILVGRRRNSSVAVEAAIPAPHVREHRGEIAFLPDVWERAYETMLEGYPGSRIVGWYHSHPGTGPSLSDYDRRLHSVLFSEAPSVALVVDPISRQAAWYGWVLGRIAPIERHEGSQLVGRPARKTRVALAAALALGLAGAGVAGYWAGHERSPDRTPSASIELRTRLGAERDRARQLADQLADAQTELRRMEAREAAQRAELAAARERLRAADRTAGPQASFLRYHVQPGDTLWSLAERFYGHGSAWKRIFLANPQRLRDPDVLLVGQTIQVPAP
jgi:proteasome lid subunit RPN8/RPN11